MRARLESGMKQYCKICEGSQSCKVCVSVRLFDFSRCFEGVGREEEEGGGSQGGGPHHINTQLFRVSHAYVTPAPKPVFSSLTTCSKQTKTSVFFAFFSPLWNLLFYVQ